MEPDRMDGDINRFREKKRLLEGTQCEEVELLNSSPDTRKLYHDLNHSRKSFVSQIEVLKNMDRSHLTDKRNVFKR